jgi:SAM-dependent methyltransferase
MSDPATKQRLLNVGGNSKEIPLPQQFADFEHLLLDIDPETKPDVLCDARELGSKDVGQFDVVYCSHNMEHYYRHDVKRVMEGFLRVLRPGGFAFIVVPDIQELMKAVATNNLDIEDKVYDSPAGPITVLDMIYGYGAEIERRGVDFFAHKTGFSPKSMAAALFRAGFSVVYKWSANLALTAIAFKGTPDPKYIDLFKLPPVPIPVPIAAK